MEKQGFVLRLEKAVKVLPTMVIETDVPVSIFPPQVYTTLTYISTPGNTPVTVKDAFFWPFGVCIRGVQLYSTHYE